MPGPECGGGADLKDYSVRWHVAAVGVMLAVSLLGSLLPVALHLSSSRPGVTTGIRLGTYFGERGSCCWEGLLLLRRGGCLLLGGAAACC